MSENRKHALKGDHLSQLKGHVESCLGLSDDACTELSAIVRMPMDPKLLDDVIVAVELATKFRSQLVVIAAHLRMPR